MADLKPEDIINFFKTLDPDHAKKFFDQISSSSSVAKDALTNLTQKFTSFDKISSTLKQSATDLVQKFQALNDVDFKDFISNIRGGNKELVTLTAQVGLLSGAILTGIKPDAFNSISDAASGMNNDLDKSVDTLSRVAKIIPSFGMAPKIVEGLRVFTELGEPAKKLESGLLSSASASGELGDLLEEVGDNLEGLERKSITYAEIIYQVSNATGYNTAQTGKYAAELSKIPGALSEIIDVSDDGSEHMHMLQAAMLAASGSGQSFHQVVDEMTRVYRDFGTTGENALEVVARLSTTSQTLKMPLDLVKDYLGGASQAFRMFGDNSQAALTILNKFGPALKEGGLGPRAIMDLTQGMTRSIADMGLAQRAFLSSTSGGPGGLQGGYQIELLKKQGKTDEVQSMVEQSLRKQFGGRILTLEEAAKDSASAAQFTKQVQLITQGPTKLASNEGEAYRILEAMAKGERGQKLIASGPGKEEALSQTLDVGNQIQERNYNQLVAITNKLDLSAQYASMTANALTRNVLGTGIGQASITQRKIESTEMAATQKMIVGPDAVTPEFDLKEALGERLDKLGNVMDDMTNLYAQMKGGISSSYQMTKDRLQGSILTGMAQPQSQVGFLANQGPVQQNNQKNASNQTQTIQVETFCQQCQKKVAQDIAIEIVDGKIEKYSKGQAMHMHTGVNMGI